MQIAISAFVRFPHAGLVSPPRGTLSHPQRFRMVVKHFRIGRYTGSACRDACAAGETPARGPSAPESGPQEVGE